MNRFYCVLIYISILFFSCGVKVPKATPDCITDIINDYAKQEPCTEGRVDLYEWDTDLYYVVLDEICCCDHQSFWYDENCNFVCKTGGIAPQFNVCNLPLDSLTFIETIWKNN